jgi:hypothetical protein
MITCLTCGFYGDHIEILQHDCKPKSLLTKLWESIKGTNDPIKHCDLYKDKGCSHVDGMLCDFPKCSMNYDYIKDKQNPCK